MGTTELMRLEQIRNRAARNVAELLAPYADRELIDMISALAQGRPWPPLWEVPLSLALEVLVAPTLEAELQRRWEVRLLEAPAPRPSDAR